MTKFLQQASPQTIFALYEHEMMAVKFSCCKNVSIILTQTAVLAKTQTFKF